MMGCKITCLQEGSTGNTLTLVPGTWAHGWFGAVIRSRILRRHYLPSATGHWFARGSPFVTSLNPEETAIYVLDWSERNSVSDRRAASLVLAPHIEELVRLSPQASHFVIAHSHGGNIALMALARMRVETARCISFAAMSTPFFWTDPRDAADVHDSYGLLMMMLYAGSVLMLAIASILMLTDGWPRLATHVSAFPNLAPFLAITLYLVLLIVLIRKGWIWWKELAFFLGKATNKTLADNDKALFAEQLQNLRSFLVLQAPADEAWLSLVLPALLMWMNRIANVAIRLSRKALGIGLWGLFLLFCALALSLSWSTGQGIKHLFLGLLGFFFVCLMLFGVLSLLNTFVNVVLGILGAIVLRTYGYAFAEGFALTLGSEVHVEHYPPGGPWSIYCASQRQKGLHHSLYESAEIQKVLAKWFADIDKNSRLPD